MFRRTTGHRSFILLLYSFIILFLLGWLVGGSSGREPDRPESIWGDLLLFCFLVFFFFFFFCGRLGGGQLRSGTEQKRVHLGRLTTFFFYGLNLRLAR